MSKNDAPFMVQIWSAEGWRDGWTIAQPYSVSGGNFVFFLRELGAGGDGNNIHIHKLRSSGKMREENAFVHSSSEGWTSVRFYKANNKIFLFLLKRAGIHEVVFACLKVTERQREGFSPFRIYGVCRHSESPVLERRESDRLISRGQ